MSKSVTWLSRKARITSKPLIVASAVFIDLTLSTGRIDCFRLA